MSEPPKPSESAFAAVTARLLRESDAEKEWVSVGEPNSERWLDLAREAHEFGRP